MINPMTRAAVCLTDPSPPWKSLRQLCQKSTTTFVEDIPTASYDMWTTLARSQGAIAVFTCDNASLCHFATPGNASASPLHSQQWRLRRESHEWSLKLAKPIMAWSTNCAKTSRCSRAHLSSTLFDEPEAQLISRSSFHFCCFQERWSQVYFSRTLLPVPKLKQSLVLHFLSLLPHGWARTLLPTKTWSNRNTPQSKCQQWNWATNSVNPTSGSIW